jgi:hypothetical protein
MNSGARLFQRLSVRYTWLLAFYVVIDSSIIFDNLTECRIDHEGIPLILEKSVEGYRYRHLDR